MVPPELRQRPLCTGFSVLTTLDRPADMTKRSLDDLRREIDEIDDAIHDLIMRRADVVKHVSAAKKGTTALPIRPSREAHMLRRLASRHDGPFQLSALARMWHEMIAAFTMIQASYKIAVFADAQHHTLWDLARDQFGSQTPMVALETRREVIQQVLGGEAEVGVLPPPMESFFGANASRKETVRPRPKSR